MRFIFRQANGSEANGEAGTYMNYDEFVILVRRIDRMEYAIGNIVSRVKLLVKILFRKFHI